jgi:YbbR domain-containing protein
MMSILRGFIKSIPTLVLSFAFAVAVWISAVTASDPVEQRVFPRAVPIEQVAQDPSLVISSEVPSQTSVTISAPVSIWDRLTVDKSPIRAWIDLSGVSAGTHTVPVNVVISDQTIRPAKIVSWNPRTVTITLEKLSSRDLPIQLVRHGEPAIGYQADTPTLDQNSVTISGPASLVEKANQARVTIDLSQASDSINRVLDVEVLDAAEKPVDGLTVTPQQVTLNQPISQRGGYRNVVVKVVSTGQVAGGYRMTNISVFPPTVTVFSTNPQLVDQMPGFVETAPLDLTGVKDDLEAHLSLNLPDGVEVSGDQTVLVQVGVAAIEGSITLTGLPVQVQNLPANLQAELSPATVDVIISGPIPLLDSLVAENVTVYLDLTGTGEGTYQFAPRVSISISELREESILPSSVEVVVKPRSTATPTPTVTPTVTPTRTR